MSVPWFRAWIPVERGSSLSTVAVCWKASIAFAEASEELSSSGVSAHCIPHMPLCPWHGHAFAKPKGPLVARAIRARRIDRLECGNRPPERREGLTSDRVTATATWEGFSLARDPGPAVTGGIRFIKSPHEQVTPHTVDHARRCRRWDGRDKMVQHGFSENLDDISTTE